MFYIYLSRLVRQGLYHQKKQSPNPQRQGVTAQQRPGGSSASSLQRQSNNPQRQGQPPQPRQHHPIHPAASQQLRYAFSGKQYQTTGNNPAQRQLYHDPHVYARSASAKNKLKQVRVGLLFLQVILPITKYNSKADYIVHSKTSPTIMIMLPIALP